MSIQLIQQAICYMKEHILEDISYVEAAKSVHMSNYNFHRTFSFVAGMTAQMPVLYCMKLSFGTKPKSL